MLIANRVEAPTLRKAVRTALESLWTIEGQKGIWAYVQGCKEDYVPKEGEVVAKAKDNYAIFKPDTEVMNAMAALIA
jgi:hypothetical protein